MRPYEPTKQQKGRGLAPSYHGHSPWSPCSCYELVDEWPSRWVECQTWCSREISSSERLQAFVAEAKAGNPFAPVTVVPPNAYAGIGLRWVLAGEAGCSTWAHGPRTLGRTAGSANHGVAAPTAAIRSSRDGCYPQGGRWSGGAGAARQRGGALHVAPISAGGASSDQSSRSNTNGAAGVLAIPR